MLIREATLAALAMLISYGGNWLVGQCMIERPICAGAIIGLLLGDVQTGVIMGASLEAIFMGAVNIGGAISANPTIATIIAVTFSIVLKIDTNAALALAIPVGVLGAFITIAVDVLFNGFAPLVDKIAAKGDDKGITMLHFGMFILRNIILAGVVFASVLLGAEPVKVIVNSIPAVIMNGLNTCGGLLPAVGFAILMKMLWSKNLAVFYFLGFVAVAYLKLPLVALAVIGIIIAVTSSMRDKQILDFVSSGTTLAAAANNQENEEGEFFK